MATFKNDVTASGIKENAIEGTAGKGRGVVGSSIDDYGMRAHSIHSSGLRGSSDNGAGVEGGSTNHYGVAGMSTKAAGVRGTSTDGSGVEGECANHYGVAGMSENSAGVRGTSDKGNGVEGWANDKKHDGRITDDGTTEDGTGVGAGVAGVVGVGGNWGTGVRGTSGSGRGVEGWSESKAGVVGFSERSHGIIGTTRGSTAKAVAGVYGRSEEKYYGCGVRAEGYTGLLAIGTICGIDASVKADGDGKIRGTGMKCSGAWGLDARTDRVDGWAIHATGPALGYAGYFDGHVQVTGFLVKAGGGFKIDHPSDPANQYLSHSFVESPNRTNIYDGTAILNAKGEATIVLPDWFEHLNHDFRYQLTAVGHPAPNLHVAGKIKDGAFKVSGGKPGMEVCWQVTGIRKDPWALHNPLHVEEHKNDAERGNYLHPKLYGQPESSTIGRREEHHTPRTGK